MHIDGAYVPRDPVRAARLMGLERTAELWKDGKGPTPPSFLFKGGDGDADREIPTDEYSEAELDEFFDTDKCV